MWLTHVPEVAHEPHMLEAKKINNVADVNLTSFPPIDGSGNLGLGYVSGSPGTQLIR